MSGESEHFCFKFFMLSCKGGSFAKLISFMDFHFLKGKRSLCAGESEGGTGFKLFIAVTEGRGKGEGGGRIQKERERKSSKDPP